MPPERVINLSQFSWDCSGLNTESVMLSVLGEPVWLVTSAPTHILWLTFNLSPGNLEMWSPGHRHEHQKPSGWPSPICFNKPSWTSRCSLRFENYCCRRIHCK